MNVSAAAAALSANAGAGVVAKAPGVDWNDVSGGGDFAGSAVGVGFADILPGTRLCARGVCTKSLSSCLTRSRPPHYTTQMRPRE